MDCIQVVGTCPVCGGDLIIDDNCDLERHELYCEDCGFREYDA